MDKAEREALKRSVQRALGAAGRAHLEPLGLRRHDRSARYWYADRVWWRLNVWFQGSGFSITVNFEAGLQTYWSCTKRQSLQYYTRTRLTPGDRQRVPLEEAPQQLDAIADAYARTAVEAVRELDEQFGDDTVNPILHPPAMGSDWLAHSGRITNIADLVIARRLAGDLAECDALIAHNRAIYDTWSGPGSGAAELKADLDDLAAVVHADDHLAAIAARIDRGRTLLGMPPMTERPTWLGS